MAKWITLGATDWWHPPCQANQKSANILIFRHYRSGITERRGSSRSLFFNALPCQKRKGVYIERLVLALTASYYTATRQGWRGARRASTVPRPLAGAALGGLGGARYSIHN